jgi:hypothetical protein
MPRHKDAPCPTDRPARVHVPLSEDATPRCPSASPLPRRRTSTSTSSVLSRRRSRATARTPPPPPCLPITTARTAARAPPPSVFPRRQPPPTSAAPLAKPPQRPSSTCTVPSPPTPAGMVPKPPCVAPHRRQLRSRRSPWTRRSSWAREPGAPGRWAGSQLGHGPPRPSVVVAARAQCAPASSSCAWAAAWSGASGPPPGFGPWPFSCFSNF